MVRGQYRRPDRSRDTAPVTADVRVLEPQDLPAAWAVLSRAFGSSVHPDDVDVELAVVDASRCYAVEQDDQMVAVAASFAFTMAVPGAVLPVAGVSWVSVLPTYRRRGLLGTLMRRQAGRPARGRHVGRGAVGLRGPDLRPVRLRSSGLEPVPDAPPRRSLPPPGAGRRPDPGRARLAGAARRVRARGGVHARLPGARRPVVGLPGARPGARAWGRLTAAGGGDRRRLRPLRGRAGVDRRPARGRRAGARGGRRGRRRHRPALAAPARPRPDRAGAGAHRRSPTTRCCCRLLADPRPRRGPGARQPVGAPGRPARRAALTRGTPPTSTSCSTSPTSGHRGTPVAGG